MKTQQFQFRHKTQRKAVLFAFALLAMLVGAAATPALQLTQDAMIAIVGGTDAPIAENEGGTGDPTAVNEEGTGDQLAVERSVTGQPVAVIVGTGGLPEPNGVIVGTGG